MITPRYSFLCTSAVEVNGSISAINIDPGPIVSGRVPFRHRRICLVFGFEYTADDAGERLLTVHVIEADGKDAVPPDTSFVIIPAPQEVTAFWRTFIEFNDLQFNSWGTQEFRVFLDQELVATTSIEVVQI